ncbi:phage tail assembly protein [uncultured Methylobacterium sp.]|jgi:hypothetical protein|uniref:phage tail assembly protein n=1 Tax=uncultured Methylobacterium sp. TaxID=157278 RepID=UPI00262688B9|nr:phage tail assembly protein [uncultured Methylobacterium sp.]
MAGIASNLKSFDLQYPVASPDGGSVEKLDVRRPKLRDLKIFVKDAENDAVGAIERIIANLSDTPPKIIAEIDLEDFAPIKTWFTGFLKLMSEE